MPASKRRHRVCENCRVRHFKCEGGTPCSQCRKRGEDCSRPLRFRVVNSSSFVDDEDSDSSTRNCPRHQVWCKIPRRNLQFIDQSVEISRSYIDGADTEYRGLSSDSELNLEQVEAHVGHGKPRHGEIRAEIRVDQGPLDQISPEVAFDASVGALLQGASTLESLGDLAHAGPLEGSVFAISPSDHYHFSSVPSYGPVPTTQRHTYVKECSAPIKDPAKAELMRCFIHQVGSILDPHDDMRGLVSNLIERAMLDPELEAAILSLSGKFLRAGGSWGAMVTSFEHHETSRNGSLTHSSGILGDSVNKAVHSILHQISVLLDETDRFETDGDSIGTSLVDEVFLPLQNPHNFTPSSDSNEGKLLWTSVWLDLYRSITRETTVQSTLHRSTLGEMSLGTDDRTWTNRILLNLVDAVDYSFGTTQSSATYNRLISYSTTWMESKPDSFTPILIQESSKGLTFPEILLISDIAIAGLQYYHLVRILLIANNPLVPRFGSSRKPAIEKQDALIRSDVRTICGMAESLGDVQPAHLNACMAIALAGDRLRGREEQLGALRILRKTTARFSWPTTRIQQFVLQAWGLSDEDVTIDDYPIL